MSATKKQLLEWTDQERRVPAHRADTRAVDLRRRDALIGMAEVAP